MSDLVADTRNAFEFVEKLYFETSYLIKEIEGQLQEQSERFVILRPSGYQVTAVHSLGLESPNVKWWLRKAMAVGFVPEDATTLNKGQTITQFGDQIKLLFVTLILFSEGLREPTGFFGLIDKATSKKESNNKFEQLMWEFPSAWEKMFEEPPKLDYEDGYCRLGGQFKKLNLFTLKTSEDVRAKLVQPMVAMYRGSGRIG